MIAVSVGLTLRLVSIGVYFASTAAVEMLLLTGQYAAASTQAERAAALAAGGAMLAVYKGTAFAAYYLMNGVALIIFAMLRSGLFERVTAVFGLLSGILMVVPSTAGTIGMYFSLASLLPWTVCSVVIMRRLRGWVRRETEVPPNRRRSRATYLTV